MAGCSSATPPARPSPHDGLSAARVREFQVLSGAGFGQLLQAQRLSVGRLSEHLRSAAP